MNLRRSLIFLFVLILVSCTHPKYVPTAERQENAVWSESIYLRDFQPSTNEPLTDEQLDKYCNIIHNNNIRSIYLFAGPYDSTGHLPDYPFAEAAQQNVTKLRQRLPGVRILPWVGGIQNKTVYLNDSSWVVNALQDTRKLVSMLHTDGVHVDFEYILPSDSLLYSELKPEQPGDREAYGRNVNNFHRELRDLLPGAFLSSVVVATSRDSKPWKRKTTISELKGLLPHIDQISFLYYDTNIHDRDTFQKNCDQLVQDIKTLKENAVQVQFLIAIGTFVNQPALWKYRNNKIENVPNTLGVIKKSLSAMSPDTPLVDGISIFCDWETDEREWNEFYENWVDAGRPSGWR